MFKFIAFACVIAVAFAQPIQQQLEEADMGTKGAAAPQGQVQVHQPVQTVLSAWPSSWAWTSPQIVAAAPQVVHTKPAQVTTTTTTTSNVKTVPVVQQAVYAHAPTVLAHTQAVYPSAAYVQTVPHVQTVQTVPLSSWAWPYTWNSPAWVAAWKKK